jgi:hypothetical protein
MAEVKFNLKPVDKKPSRRHRKGSKYDPVVDPFMESYETLVSIDVEEKNDNYLRTKLYKRIEARKLARIKVYLIYNVTYLEKI